MSEGRKRIRSYGDDGRRNRAYVYGTAVPKRVPETLPERKEKQTPKIDKHIKRNRNRVLQMTLGYVSFLTVVAVAVVFVCIQCLQVQANITKRTRNIASLTSQVNELRQENDAYYNRVVNSVNLEDIKKTAVLELGMHYPSSSQIRTYTCEDEEYVRQLQDFPQSNR